ncbi:MAG TPA: DUF1684 domain-containing protein, partial [Pyrinomonadaceae bacterium]|nr:DUF1684 domain-containing protein [Pyrinomonadaceae bacterium]
KIDANTYANEIEQWQKQRLADLKSEDGWLTLAGLFWLKEGHNKLGSDKSDDIVLAKEKIGAESADFLLTKGGVQFATRPNSGFTVAGKPVTQLELKSDEDGAGSPTVLQLGSLTFQIIKRGEKLGLRVKDKQNPDRLNFQGTQFYPTDLKWRIEAQFVPYNPPKTVSITNVLGMESGETSPGAVKFSVDGSSYQLDAITEKGETKYFMIIADKTSGKETYPAGRYLYVDPPDAAGRMVIDFNRAYSPPCAFTKFATCPLPPRQNRLPFAINAGEKYSGHPRVAVTSKQMATPPTVRAPRSVREGRPRSQQHA